MDDIQYITNESVKELDSLVNQYLLNANAVKIEDFPSPNNFRYESKKAKRKDQFVNYPTDETILDIYKVIHLYTIAVFASDPLLKSFILQTYNIKEVDGWFVDVSELKSELKKIVQTGIFKIDAELILELIHNYIHFKIHAFLISKYFSKIGKDEFIYHTLRNHIKANQKAKRENRGRIQTKGAKQTKIGLELINDGMYILTQKKYDLYEVIDFLYHGKCEGVFMPIIINKCIIPIKPNTGTYGQKLLVSFYLFKLIMKDRYLWSEQDFENIISSYKNYDSYKKRALKSFLQ